jgi:hypothetical protein
MTRLQHYYFRVGTPVVLLVLGALIFFDQIRGTVSGNPHPQINYLIFILIVFGSVQMIMHVVRINREAALLEKAAQLITQDGDLDGAKALIESNGNLQSRDVCDVLLLLIETHGKMVGPVQHAAIEAEIERFQSRQNRRLLLAQFMSGMMVGLGLLGTFIGLLGALDEIGKLIGSFSLGPGTTDPITAVSELVARLTAPMKAMGIAFSASLFGVLGSLIMSMLMVFVKSATVELVSLVQSRVSWMTDISHQQNELSNDRVELANALAGLAEHSPVLQGLVVALDQSERRVRQLLTGVQELTAQIVTGTAAQSGMTTHLATLGEQQALSVQVIQGLQVDMSHMRKALLQSSDNAQILAANAQQQQEQLQQALSQQHGHMQAVVTMNQGWVQQAKEQADTQRQQWSELKALLTGKQVGLVQSLELTQSLLSENAQRAQRESELRVDLSEQMKVAFLEQHQFMTQVISHTQTHADAAAQIARTSEQQANAAKAMRALQQDVSQTQHAFNQSSEAVQQLTQSVFKQQVLLDSALQQQDQQLKSLAQMSRDWMQQMQEQARQQGQQWVELRGDLAGKQTGVIETLQSTQQMLAQSTRDAQLENKMRLELAQQMKAAMQEQQDRHEQLLYSLTVQLSRISAQQE